MDHGKKNLNFNYPEFRQKMDLFFIDYDMIPMLMHENYLNAMGDRRDIQSVEDMARAADYISLGDSVSI